ncbi:MAG: hypothetical protein MRERV_64c009 [Mycoplasmataceae bacterium RV_VA103A]|nr:MAG: hypothetical protein MRERV_64c009 [Mycoplasmataceae bacterium RV_VA103A]
MLDGWFGWLCWLRFFSFSKRISVNLFNFLFSSSFSFLSFFASSRLSFSPEISLRTILALKPSIFIIEISILVLITSKSPSVGLISWFFHLSKKFSAIC